MNINASRVPLIIRGVRVEKKFPNIIDFYFPKKFKENEKQMMADLIIGYMDEEGLMEIPEKSLVRFCK